MVGNERPFFHVRRKMVVARIEFISRLAAFNKKQLVQPCSDNTLSPLSIAYHLYEVDGLALQHMRVVLAEDDPLLSNVMDVPLALAETKCEMNSLDAVLAAMAARREELFIFLAALPPSSWLRPFHFADSQQRTLYQLVSMLPLHDQQHARQLAMLKARVDA
jgi:hypothetical protein